MSDNATQMMTNVKGYFNPNSYRVNVSISELGGMSIQLDPMQFILDRATGRKINDPMLDKYVGYKMLSPELSNAPVPVVPMPKMVPTAHSQHVVMAGVKDAQGRWQPAAPGSAPPQVITQTPPNVSKPSVSAMSMDEARKRGLVGRTKLVPDDYGATETDGAPMRGDGIPRIKYAMESAAPNARPGQLPQELVEQVDPKLAPILAGLQAAANTDPESVNLGRRAAEKAVAAQQGAEGVQKFRAAVKQVKATVPTAVIPPPSAPAPVPGAASVSPVGIVQPRRRRVAQVVTTPSTAPAAAAPPAPPVTPVPPSAPPVPMPESPIMAGLPAPTLEPAPETVQEAQAEVKAKYVCNEPGCNGKEFPFKSTYIRHIQGRHKDKFQLLMPK